MRSLGTFFALTCALSWACFGAAAALPGVPLVPGALLLAGTFAPALVALSMTARSNGPDGAAALVDRLLQAPAGVRWYVFAAGYPVAIKLGVALVYHAAVGAWPRFGDTDWYVIAAAIALSTPVQAGEEIGWRGYALPRLAQRFGLARASLILGIVWALWHLPLFFIPGVGHYGQSIVLFVVDVTALSVAMAWLYARTGGSLLLVMLMHSAVNQSTFIVPSAVAGATNPFALSESPSAWLSAGFLWAGAAYFLVSMRRLEITGAAVTTAAAERRLRPPSLARTAGPPPQCP